jgi:hypothetical protein
MSDVSLPAEKQVALTEAVLGGVLKDQEDKGPDLRQVHPKSHALVWGECIVEADIPPTLKVGVFAEPKSYPIWARFSNAAGIDKRGTLKSDLEPDIRGLAIKLLEVPGQKLMEDEAQTQDFIFLNHPVFIVRDMQGFVNLGLAGSGQADPAILASLAPTFEIIKAATSKSVANPLLIQYWSTTPYKLGSQIIKFSVKPHRQDVILEAKPTSENYLREAAVHYLTVEGQEASFDFLVQIFVDSETTPIEDGTVEWKEIDTPFIKVATIRIPAQKFDFPERHRLDEGIAFSPWHTLLEHEPVGGLNLARKKIYLETAKFRHTNIEQRLREPQPYNAILDDPK